jgi:hypothetical protein
MRFEQIDEALRQQPTWEPPPSFARRVARMTQPLHVDAPVRLLDVLTFAPQTLRDALLNVAATVAGWKWTVRQYWLLVSQ